MKDKWTHFVYVYNSTDKTRALYLNGELVQRDNFNLWPADAKERTITGLKYGGTAPEVLPELAFGFIQSHGGTLWDNEDWGGYEKASANHFKGSLDDVLIYHKVVSAAEIQLMYNSGR